MPPIQQPMSSSPVQPEGGSMRQMETNKTAPVEKPKDTAGLVKTIIIIVLSLIAVTFIGLFIWMFIQYSDVQNDIDEKIDAAVAKARDEQITKDEAEFAEREKYPYKVFTGPADYGSLSFQYPKTWSVYVADSATSGGDFKAYFNPIQVDTVAKDTVNALRVSIRNKAFDEVAEEYQKAMNKKDSNLTMESVTVNGITANRYTGTIPDTENLSGFIIIFKIRDKTAVVQTDSALFKDDYDKLIQTITFNE